MTLKVTFSKEDSGKQIPMRHFYIPPWADEDWAKRNAPLLRKLLDRRVKCPMLK